MASPSHYVRSFAAHSNPSRGSHNLGGLINQYPPGLGYGPQEVPYRALTRRRPSHSAPLVSPRRPHGQHPFSQPHPQPSYNKFDPFADENAIELVRPEPLQTIHHSFQKKRLLQPSLPSTSSSQLVPHSMVHDPWPPFANGRENPTNAVTFPNAVGNRDARARLVAGILLNRVHAVGKPMRRRYYAGEPREYVKSRLSSVITADA